MPESQVFYDGKEASTINVSVQRVSGEEIAPRTFEGVVSSIQKESHELMVRKQLDYGKGNIAKFGAYGIVVRASDKLERLQNLLESGRKPSNEALEDSAMDLMNYGLIMLMVMRGQWGLPVEAAGESSDDSEVYEGVTYDG